MKIGFILTCYDRIDDLLAHLDILKFFPHPHEIIPIWMKEDIPDYFLQEMSKYPHAHFKDGMRFDIGPLMGLISGLRKAKELGLDYICYRNGDDWLFNHQFVLENFTILENENKHCAGYNWLSVGDQIDFASNEVYMRVGKFTETLDEAEHYFLKANKKVLCEFKISRWIRKIINMEKFYRLPYREQEPGIGYETETLPEVFIMSGKTPLPDLKNLLKDNSRFFNRKWQLIGSHNNYQRYCHYYDIRKSIPYHLELEKLPNFNRWIRSCQENTKWNLPISERKRELPVGWQSRRPLFLRSLPKLVPKKFIRPV